MIGEYGHLRPKIQGLKLWRDLGMVAVTNDGKLDADFEDLDGTVIFEEGTQQEEVWHWFEETFEDFTVGYIMNGKDEDWINFREGKRN